MPVSSVALDSSSATPPLHLPEPDLAALAHIPGDDGLPIVGDTFRLLADRLRSVRRLADRYGLIARNRAFGVRSVALLGPDSSLWQIGRDLRCDRSVAAPAALRAFG